MWWDSLRLWIVKLLNHSSISMDSLFLTFCPLYLSLNHPLSLLCITFFLGYIYILPKLWKFIRVKWSLIGNFLAAYVQSWFAEDSFQWKNGACIPWWKRSIKVHAFLSLARVYDSFYDKYNVTRTKLAKIDVPSSSGHCLASPANFTYGIL